MAGQTVIGGKEEGGMGTEDKGLVDRGVQGTRVLKGRAQ